MRTPFIRFFIVSFFIAASAMGQSGVLSGTVVDKETGLSLAGSTVALYAAGDTVILQGAVTDEEGSFRLHGIANGEYRLVVSFIGFIEHEIERLLVRGNTALGRISLESNTIMLGGVEVAGNRTLIEHTLEKSVYNVESDILAESASVSDMLQNIPSVSVDIDGNVTLRGSGSITFFIDGRPSALLRRNAATALQQMPASAIARIEVITNPSARYRPEGVGGIINIVMKKERGGELSGQLGVNGGNEKRSNAYANLNYGIEDVQLFGKYSIRKSGRSVLYEDSRVFRDALSGAQSSAQRESGSSLIDALSHTVSLGASADLDEHNSVEISGLYFLQNADHLAASDITGFAPDASQRERYRSAESNDEYESEGEAAFAFEHMMGDNEDHTFSVEASVAAYDEREDQRYEQRYSLPDETAETSSNLVEKGGTQWEAALHYVRPFDGDAVLESGYAGEFIREDIRHTLDDAANRFLLDRDVHAVYATYGQPVADFSFKAGLRVEHTGIAAELVAPRDSISTNSYFELFPTLHLGYALSDAQRLSLSYSRRISRPDADELNPNPEYSDPRTAEVGNTQLLPEQTHSFEFGYQAMLKNLSLTNTLYFRSTYDAFTSIRSSIGDSIVLYTFENLDTQNALGFESVVSGSAGEDVDFDLTGNVYYTTIDATRLGYGEKKSVLTGRIKAYARYRLLENTALQVTGYYYFPSITPQGQRDPYHYFNAGLQQQLFDRRVSVTLSVTDVLHSFSIARSIRSDALDQDNLIKRKQPVVYVGLSWRFNSDEDTADPTFENETLTR